MPTYSRRRLLTLLAAFPAARRVIAQQTATPPTYSTSVNVVNLFATVHDKDGHVVSNLSKEDFALAEEGRPQVIRYFSREADLPLTLGLLVDTSMSQRRVIGDERNASYTFLQHVLRDKDQAFVIHFDREVELLQDLTSSRPKLEKALRELEVQQPAQSQERDRDRRDGSGSHHGGGTALYDSVLLASDELMKKQQGRKAVIILSDGVDRGSKVSMTQAIEHAQRADTLVYSILFADHEGYGGGFGGFGGRGMGRRGGGYPRDREERPDGKKVLERISKETGGAFFEVSKKETIDKIYDQVQQELRNQYSIGYTPDQAASDKSYRHITLTVNKKGFVVQARDGYYPG